MYKDKNYIKRLLKKHTNHQIDANIIKEQIEALITELNPDSPLLCEYGCLSVTEPDNWEKLVLEELEKLKNNESS